MGQESDRKYPISTLLSTQQFNDHKHFGFFQVSDQYNSLLPELLTANLPYLTKSVIYVCQSYFFKDKNPDFWLLLKNFMFPNT